MIVRFKQSILIFVYLMLGCHAPLFAEPYSDSIPDSEPIEDVYENNSGGDESSYIDEVEDNAIFPPPESLPYDTGDTGE